MKKKLRIAHIAPLWFTIPPRGYGGIERIVAYLCDLQVEAGHKVTLFAPPESKTRAKLVSVYPAPLIKAGISWNNHIWNLRNISLAIEMANQGKFDIVHSHLDLWTLFFQNLTKTPVIHTMHNPMYISHPGAHKKDDRLKLFSELSRTTNLAFISKSARNIAQVTGYKKSPVVYNGIDSSKLKFNKRGGKHFIWIARVNKHKGIENAITAAEVLGAELHLSGRLDKTMRGYFRDSIKPHLNRKIRFKGESLSTTALSRFYGTAKALLYPIEWEEPFGLVVAEAMACGTPVIAYNRGSMSELIEHGKTGFVVNNMRELIEAMKNVDQIDRRACRYRVEKYFAKEVMSENYENLYYQLIRKKR